MVEGPKVLLKSQKLQILVGQILLKYIFKSEIQTNIPSNEKVVTVFSVGKELLIVLESVCIRLHFGMNGTETIRKTSEGNIEFCRKRTYGRSLIAVLEFDSKTVELFNCTVMIKDMSFVDHVREKSMRDVLLENFFSDVVIEWLYDRDKRPIMDSIMDQNILPGVGNVIKCEGLFRSRISPYQLTNTIPRNVLTELITHLKDFSFEWYYATKHRNRSLNKQVYGFQNCKVCNSTVTLIRDGKIKRITYFCPICQPIQNYSNMNKSDNNVDNLDNFGHSAPIFQSYSPISNRNEFMNNESVMTIDLDEENKKNTMKSLNDNMTTDISPSSSSSSSHNTTYLVDPVESCTDFNFLNQPLCACKASAQLQRVRKEGMNKGRMFWSCSHAGRQCSDVGPREKKCSFFHWADSLFPLCACAKLQNQTSSASSLESQRNNVCVLRRVLKTGPTNGKYFFACKSLNEVQQCGFFLWAAQWNQHILYEKEKLEERRIQALKLLETRKKPENVQLLSCQSNKRLLENDTNPTTTSEVNKRSRSGIFVVPL
jgi:formamidopyrimidine-DNA glycosylase